MTTAAVSFSPEELPIARVYAQALWNLAKRDGVTDSLLEEYRALVTEVLDQNPSAEAFFRSMTIGREKREQVVRRSFTGQLSDLLFNFLLTLNRHDRLGMVRSCLVGLEDLYDEERNIVSVEVRSAVPLSDERKSELEGMIRQRFGVEPRLLVSVDPALLGGLWVRVGDTVLDLTLKTNVRKLRDVLRTRNSHEIQSGRSYFDLTVGN